MSIWDWLLNPAGLTAHGFCLSWAPGLVALHAGSDALIGLAYFSIPVAMAWFIQERRDFPHWRIAYLFAAFILACGTTHLFSILTLWVPAYGIEGLVKAVTAALSIATAIALYPLVPRLLALPTPELLVGLNTELSRRVAAQEQATAGLRESEAGMRALNADLERRVAERTSALEAEIVARRDAEEKFRQVIESAPSAMIMIDGEGMIELVNVQAERTFGYSREELLGRSIDILLPDRLRAVHGHHRATFFASPTPRPMGIGHDLFGRRKDGSEFPVEIGLNPLMTPEGQKVISSISDITKRKEIEEALVETGALQRAIFNSANFSSIATDSRGVIQVFNVGAERMLGYTAVEVMNKITPADISDPQELIARARALSVELATPISPGFEALVFKASRGIEDIYELTYIRKDLSRFPAMVSVTALRDAQNVIIGYLLIGTDNTARKLVEAEQMILDQRLRDQQFYTRSLIEANIDAIMTTDPSGIITDVNKQMEKLTDCTRDELIGAPFKDFFTDPERAEAAIKRALSEKSVTDYELTARARDGALTVVSYNATTFYDGKRTLQGVFAAARDVTEAKRVEAELLQTKVTAESASRIKSNFLASMSHEIRTPMNGVIGFADLLLDSDLTELQRNHMTRLQDAAKSLLALMNDILDLSKIEAGKLEVESIPMSPETVVHSAASIVRTQLAAKGLDLSIERAPDLPDWIESDPTRLRQILLNLLSNALKFTDHGRITVRSSRETVEDQDFMRFEIRDTGIGIPADRQHLLFRDFSQIDSSTTRRYGGTGLGLSICKRLAQAMGGEIGVSSVPGSGSTIWFTIALRTCPPPDLSVARHPTTLVANPASVLVADDLEMNRDIVEAMLRRAGHSVRGVENGRQAVIAVEESDFDVVLMDMEMPEMDGIAATRAIRRLDERIRLIPIVALTANAFSEDQQRCREAGMNDFLPKPISRDGLLAMVAKWSGGIPPEMTETAPSTPLVLDQPVLDAFDSALGVEGAAWFSAKIPEPSP